MLFNMFQVFFSLHSKLNKEPGLTSTRVLFLGCYTWRSLWRDAQTPNWSHCSPGSLCSQPGPAIDVFALTGNHLSGQRDLASRQWRHRVNVIGSSGMPSELFPGQVEGHKLWPQFWHLFWWVIKILDFWKKLFKFNGCCST